MAGDWIKVEIGLAEKPEVFQLSRLLTLDRNQIIGLLVKFWSWADRSTVDGRVDGVASHDVDAVVDVDGFCAALCAVKWLHVDAENLRLKIPNFERHNGESVKKRILKNQRQARWRDNRVDANVDAPTSTNASTREEKRRDVHPTAPKSGAVKENPKSAETWTAYSTAYQNRYQVEPVRNAQVNAILAKLVSRLGSHDAPQVAAYYLTHDRAQYVTAKHAVSLLLRDAEGLRTEWATGSHTTEDKARQLDKLSGQREVWRKLASPQPREPGQD